ncbi:MAG: glycosyltransferase family 2 protein [Nitrospirota bacterium]|nr:glycosyltransferase family 2 protein [Nitrospirota bacterium]
MMSHSPLVSVVIPVFNGASFLARAVESVFAQTWTDFEIILVDDGSTDGTPAVLERLAQMPRILCLHQANAGPAQARNVGAQAAKGTYIAFLDCDDIWLPDKLEAQVTILRGTSQPGLVHSHYEVIDPAGKVIQHAKAGQSQDVFHQVFTGGQAPLLSTTIMSRALLEEVGGFDPNLWVSEDTDLILRLYELTTFEWVDQVLVHKFQQVPRDGDDLEAEGSYREKVLRSRERFLTRVQHRSTLNPEQVRALNREWSSYYVMKGALEERQRCWAGARQQYVAAIKKDPFRLRGYTRFLRALRW